MVRVFHPIGYRGTARKSLPFDDATGVIRNVQGRVVEHDENLPGVYGTGWIKRVPNGVIGSNKKCARETTHCLLEDFTAGRLNSDALSPEAAEAALLQRCAALVTQSDWHRIDSAERLAGTTESRPRVKFTDKASLLDAAGVSQ